MQAASTAAAAEAHNSYGTAVIAYYAATLRVGFSPADPGLPFAPSSPSAPLRQSRQMATTVRLIRIAEYAVAAVSAAAPIDFPFGRSFVRPRTSLVTRVRVAGIREPR